VNIIRNLIIATAAVVFAPALSHATIVINNLAMGTQSFGASLSGPTAEFFPGSPFDNREIAFTFTTGADVVTLTSLTFSVNVGAPSISPIEFTLSTGSAVPGGTGALSLGSVAPLSDTPVGQTLTLTPSSTVTLNAATEYWLHVTVPAGGGIYAFNNTNTPTFAPGWSLGNTWYYEPDFGGGWTEVTSGPKARISMNVATVPEPTTAVLGSMGALLLLRRRR
jgi:hypothetical protein